MRKLWKSGAVVRLAAWVMGLILLAVALAPWLSPYNPTAQDITHRLMPPSPGHLLGTDGLGRDVLSRILYGGRLSISVGLIAVVIEFVVGTALGILSGYAGGWVDLILMRVMDVLLAVPGLVLALFIVAILGPGLGNVMVALGIGGVPGVARLVRGSTLMIRGREYVQSAVTFGARHRWITLRHILPNVLPPVMVLVTVDVGTIVLSAAGLSFIGLGAQPPSPEWGAMLAESQTYFPNAWWMSVFPGLAITIVVLCLNIIGDALRDVIDPWMRGANAGAGGRGAK